jgi:hypothetical protein
MRCGNPLCRAEGMYFRNGSLRCVDCAERSPGNANVVRRQVIWLCQRCSDDLTVETWRPPGEQIRPRRFLPARPPGGQRVVTAA